MEAFVVTSKEDTLISYRGQKRCLTYNVASVLEVISLARMEHSCATLQQSIGSFISTGVLIPVSVSKSILPSTRCTISQKSKTCRRATLQLYQECYLGFLHPRRAMPAAHAP